MNEMKSLSGSYGLDFFAWSSEQAKRLRRLKPAGLDWSNLAEEVEGLGKSDRRAIGSALKVVLEHLLKWQFQPHKRSPSWSDSIDEHRDRIARIIADSPSLANLPAESLNQEYHRARRKVLRDTKLTPRSIPAACPFRVKEALDPDFYPAD